MTGEVYGRETMKTTEAAYVGAFIADERRLVLASVDPSEPWEAFRTLRRTLRRTAKAADAQISLFESPVPLEHKADVISIQSRRRAG